MNEDNPAARTDITEQPPSLFEKVVPPPLGATAGVIGGAVTGALLGVAAGPVGGLLGAVGAASLGGALGAFTTVGPQTCPRRTATGASTTRRVPTCLPAPTTRLGAGIPAWRAPA